MSVDEHGVPNIAPIAICGIGVRLPRDICTPEEMYEFLLSGLDARSPPDESRYNARAFHYQASGGNEAGAEKPLPSQGYWLNWKEISSFDASLFNLPRKEIDRLDPQQRVLLRVVWEALESAGEADWRGKNIGCYVGSFGDDWRELHARDELDPGGYRLTGYMDYALSNRISSVLDLRGPSMTVRAACAASGLALHLACQAIRAGECDSAIVAGSNIILSPDFGCFMAEHGILSPDASCRTFDAQANGYARAEAVNCVFLKSLDSARHDGNPVRAIIRGSATNADGRTVGMSTPNAGAHETLIRSAYRMAGIWDFGETAMVECHGTGTTVGDAIETCAVARVFGEKGVVIGSIILDSASSTYLPNGQVLSSNYRKPPTPPLSPTSTRRNSNLPATLLVFSSGNAESLRNWSEQVLSYHALHPERRADLAYTLMRRRLHHPFRSYRVVDDNGDLYPKAPVSCIRSIGAQKGSAGIVFVFSGQGTAWARMGVDLLKSDPEFLKDMRAMDQVLSALPVGRRPSWTIQGELFKTAMGSRLSRADFSQPICTALQIALVRRLERHGIQPAAVVGHSSGEIAAAYAAGALSLTDAVTAAYYRGLVCSGVSEGGMAFVGLGSVEASQFLMPKVTIACENSEASVTLSGSVEALQRVTEAIEASRPGVFVRKLRVNNAYHSPFMADVADEYLSYLAAFLRPRAPSKPFYSSVTSRRLYKASDFDATYWRNSVVKPVLFRQAVKALLKDHAVSVQVEIGPHPVLLAPLKQIGTEAGVTTSAVPIMYRGVSAEVTFLAALGQLYCHGIPIDLPTPQDVKALADLPPYAWDLSKTYWSESRVMKNWRFRKFPQHELLGIRNADDSSVAPTWRSMLSLDDLSWINDHWIGNTAVLPASAYVAMAGEVVFQLTGERAYTIRELTITTALTLEPGCHLEVMTVARHAIEKSQWLELSIQSCKDETWTTHCTGMVRPGRASRGPRLKDRSLEPYLRIVDPQVWYRCAARIGYKYGPSFKDLQDIRASVSSPSVKLVVRNADSAARLNYQTVSHALHPKTVDKVFQALTIAFHSGHPRLLTRLLMPTYAEEIFIDSGLGIESLLVNATAEAPCTTGPSRGRGDIVAYGSPQPKGDPVLYAKGFCFSPGSRETQDDDPHGAIQMVWKPSIDLIKDLSSVIRPTSAAQLPLMQQILEKFSVMCAITVRQAADLFSESVRASWPSHFKKFHGWLDKYIAENMHLVPAINLANVVALNNDMDILANTLNGTPAADAAALMLCCTTHAEYILDGSSSALDLFLQDGALHRLYDWMNSMWSYDGYLELVAHQRGNHLRVLEIGAGTGGLTERVLKGLNGAGTYIFTDISSGFFAAAKERFKEFPGVEYRVLDITRDPIAQGFDKEGYDLVIASNVLHVTEDVAKTLHHVRSLLKPQGQLLMQELACETKWINLIMGFLPGWWLGDSDGRKHEPYISPRAWEEQLRCAGFMPPEGVFLDAKPPYQLNATILARPASPSSRPKTLGPVTAPRIILLHDDGSPLVKVSHARDLILQAGYETLPVIFGDPLPPGPVISILDTYSSTSFFNTMTEQKLGRLNLLLDMLKKTDSPILWLTRPCQVCPTEPSFALVLGVARTARQELGVRFAVMELNARDSTAMKAVCQVMARQLDYVRQASLDMDDPMDKDMEFVYRADTDLVLIPRSTWISVPQALIESRSRHSRYKTYKALQISRPGHLPTLSYALRTHPPALDPSAVEVCIHAAGLNFKDILTALNISSVLGSSGPVSLGCEAAGLVTAVGKDVSRVRLGDRVMLFAPQAGCFSTSVRVTEALCARIPDNLSFLDAAGMPCIFATVLRALVDKGRLGPRKTVLIHSAAGGTGLAAIQVARWLGAEVYATAGTNSKRRFLQDTAGISPGCVFGSRDKSFADDLMEATGGRGVDVVLNSLSGELLHASWRCLAPGGTFIELGKRDAGARCKLPMEVLDDNRSFVGIDMAQLAVANGDEIGMLLDRIVQLNREGVLKPIVQSRSFSCTEIREAFQCLAKGTHIGKIVVDFVGEHINQDSLALALDRPEPSFRPECVYIIAGGIGGLGTSIVRWLADHGARNLAILSRSAGSSAHDVSIIDELQGMGCTVHVRVCDVTDEKAVQDVLSSLSSLYRIGGVIHLAMVLADVELSRMTADDWQAAVAPKVTGAQNLHSALVNSGCKEDFFVLIGSMFGVTGRAGQANYAAANTFLNSFTQYRRGLGLPCSVLDVGPLEGVGTLARKRELFDAMSNSGARFLTEQDVLDGLHLAIVTSRKDVSENAWGNNSSFHCPAQVGLGFRCRLPLDDPQNSVVWKRDPRMAFYSHHERDGDSESMQAGNASALLNQFVCRAKDRPSELDNPASAVFLGREIARRVLASLMVDNDDGKIDSTLSMSLSSFAMDSLVAIEIRSWWRAAFGVDVNIAQLTMAPSFKHLGLLAARQMKERFCTTDKSSA
ncbi:putative polyketide synthase [Colletotrichum sublineola]|uniref:Putative polyketide synthase n=1 Tax=Colletotrichum sublineola TaxID=1173701 RepID=A0A066X991_COLSU|nr:putative polyketide synthase [Colletotrichum sublineola]